MIKLTTHILFIQKRMLNTKVNNMVKRSNSLGILSGKMFRGENNITTKKTGIRFSPHSKGHWLFKRQFFSLIFCSDIEESVRDL